MTVYLDRVFLLNLLLDDLLLLCAARFCGRPLVRWRYFLAAIFGAIYAVTVFLPGCQLLAHPIIRCIVGAVMTAIAYAGQFHWPRLAAFFFLLSAGFAGAVLALGLMVGSPAGLALKLYTADISWAVLLGSAVLFSLLLRIFFGQAGRYERGELMKITVLLKGQKQTLTALRDTGNALRDPVRGEQVLVAEQQALLWPDNVRRILRESIPPEEKAARLYAEEPSYSFTLLPFQAVGTSSGLLLAVRSDAIIVEGRKIPHALIALWDHAVSDGGNYQALWGGTERSEKNVAEIQATSFSVAAGTK